MTTIQFIRSQGFRRKRVKWDAGYPPALIWVGPTGRLYYWTHEAYKAALRRKRAGSPAGGDRG